MTSSLSYELFRFGLGKTVTPAAFCKQRDKLNPEALLELNHALVRQVPVQRWKNLRLLAIDGTTLSLPKHDSIVQHFGEPRPNHQPTARVSQLYDVANQLTLDVQVTPMSTGERSLAVCHLEHCQSGDLVLADRGYTGQAFYQECLNRKIEFCIRVPISHSKAVFHFYKSGAAQQIIQLSNVKPSLRLIRVPLDGAEDEVLITSLTDTQAYPLDDFKALYFRRWGVEEDYKKMKSRLHIEQFSGKKYHCVMQDIYATVFHKNWLALCVLSAQAKVDAQLKKTKHTKQVNFTQASRLLKQAWCTAFALDWGSLIDTMSCYCNSVRAGRTAVRRKKKKQPPAMAYKLGGA